MALIGLTGAIATSRTTVANNYISNLGKYRIEGAFNFLKLSAELGTSNGICRTFVRSPFSPPPDVLEKMQKDYDTQCAWFKKVVKEIESLDRGSRKPVDVAALAGKSPMVGDEWAYTALEKGVSNYNQVLERVAELEDSRKLTYFEQVIAILSPSILAIALALRITKVTGEVSIDRAKRRSES